MIYDHMRKHVWTRPLSEPEYTPCKHGILLSGKVSCLPGEMLTSVGTREICKDENETALYYSWGGLLKTNAPPIFHN